MCQSVCVSSILMCFGLFFGTIAVDSCCFLSSKGTTPRAGVAYPNTVGWDMLLLLWGLYFWKGTLRLADQRLLGKRFWENLG